MIVAVELKQEGQYWTLYVNGIARIQHESFAICDQVADQVRAGAADASECGELAQMILTDVRRTTELDAQQRQYAETGDEHLANRRAAERHVVRFVATHIGRDGMRTITGPTNGRYMQPTPGDAQRIVDLIQRQHSREKLVELFGAQVVDTFAVRAVACWPGHHDPIGVYFE
jgi:hypothetical protein